MRLRLLLAALPLTLPACASTGIMVGGPGVGVGFPTRRAEPAFGDTVVDRLYFGRSIPGGGTVSDSAWTAFLGEVVTPRFPAGLTVYRAQGQWRSDAGAIEREESYVLEIVHPSTRAIDTLLQEVAAEYRLRFRQESVLRATSPVRLRFYR